MRMSDAIKKAQRKGVVTVNGAKGYGQGAVVNTLGAIYVGRFGLEQDGTIERDAHVITRRLRETYPQLEQRGRATVGLGKALKMLNVDVQDWESQSLLRTLVALDAPSATKLLDLVRL